MRFTWDENKRASNLAKHKVDLLQARQLFDGRPLFTYPSPRDDEARCVSVGVLDDRMVAIVWFEREDGIRLISLRKARDAEKRTYRELHG
jgi:uncharacterized DUF497 family protein